MASNYRGGARWRPSEVQELQKFWNEGLPVEWIANYFSRTHSAIESAVAKRLPKEFRNRKPVLNPARKWTVDRIEELRRYWVTGMHIDEICIKMKSSLCSVHNAAKRYLGSDYKRNVIARRPAKRLQKTSLNRWTGPHADEHAAWLRMVHAKSGGEKIAAQLEWANLNLIEQAIIFDQQS